MYEDKEKHPKMHIYYKTATPFDCMSINTSIQLIRREKYKRV